MAGSKRGSNSKRWSQEVKDRVLQLRREGTHFDFIQQQTGVPPGTAQMWCNAAKIRVPYTRRTSTSRKGMKQPKRKNKTYTIRGANKAAGKHPEESLRNTPLALDIEKAVRRRVAQRRD